MLGYYENHVSIRKNKLCPFKLAKAENSLSTRCNWHKNIEILLVVSGEGRIQYATEQYSLDVGDMIVINSGALHRPYSEKGVGYYYLIIDESFCLENGLDLTRLDFEKKVRDPKTEALFFEVVRCMGETEEPLASAQKRSSVLSLLIDLCGRHASPILSDEIKTAPSEEYVKFVLNYINENFAQPIRLETLAEHCGITKFHLSREFKRYTGQTIFAYVNILRCKNAELCLAEGMSVTQAAHESGFESLPYFSRTYRKLMGVCPSRVK